MTTTPAVTKRLTFEEYLAYDDGTDTCYEYTFSRYFELPFTIDDILAELNCTIERKNLTLPESSEIYGIQFLQQQLRRNFSHSFN